MFEIEVSSTLIIILVLLLIFVPLIVCLISLYVIFRTDWLHSDVSWYRNLLYTIYVNF